MSALKVLDLARQQGLLDEQAADELRSQIALSPRSVSASEVVNLLLEQGHLTQFQAKRLLETATGGARPMGEDLLAPAPAPPVAGGNDEDDDDVVMLEAVEPTAPPPTPAPPPPSPPPPSKQPLSKAPTNPPPAPKPTPPAAPPAKKQPSKPTPPAVTAPMEFADPSTELEPIGELRPITPLRPIGGMKPLQPLEPIGPSEGLQPLGTLEPIGMLQPIGPAQPSSPAGGDDLFSDPLLGAAGLTPLDPLTGQNPAAPQQAQPRRAKRNQWDSPLLLIGGGVLGAILLAFALLYLSLTRGSAAEVLAKADQEYDQGAYANAIAAYDTFLKKYPEDENASLARVRRGMAQIRSVSDGGKDPAAGLKRAQEVLPQIESEARFSDARVELAQILPGIADGFAQQAQDSQDSDRRAQLVQSTEEAMALVTNPAYIPASLRKDIEGRITSIVDKLKLARRSIDQDQELQAALEKMNAATEAGKVADGYQVRKTLLRAYPQLSVNASLTAATLAIAQRERELVEVTRPNTPAIAEETPPPGFRVVLANRTCQASPAAAGERAFFLLEGAVYALEVRSGKVAWRRFVGLETLQQPVPLSNSADADVLVTDARSHSLLRLHGPSGKLVWRQQLDEPFFAPLVSEQTVFTTTASGRLLALNLESGEVTTQAQLPQRATVAACLEPKQGRLYQLGEHSTVFVFDARTLECVETFYLGHTPGAILASPVVVLEHLLIPQSPSDAYSLLHVLKLSKENKLAEVVSPFRLKGRTTAPLSTSGRRAVVVTDLGQISVFEVDPGAEKQSVRELARVAATDSERTSYSAVVEGNRLWVAGRRCTMYEIQSSVQQLSRGWSVHQDDLFVGPLQVRGPTLLHTRRRPGSPEIIVEACKAADGSGHWRTTLGAPIVVAAASDARAQVVAVTSPGHVFEVPRDSLSAGTMDQPTASPPMGSGNWNLQDATSLGEGRWLLSNLSAGPQALLYDVTAADNRVRWLEIPGTREATAPPTFFHGGILTPLRSGRVLLLSPETGRERMLPFQPTLEAGVALPWTHATSLPPDGSTAAISDGLTRLFRIGVKDQPQPHLAAVAEGPTAGPTERPLAAAGDTIYAVHNGSTGQTLAAYNLENLARGTTWPLTGRCKLGPVAVGDRVYVADEESLYCLSQGQQLAWKSPLEGRSLACPPLLKDGNLILVHRSGTLTRLAADSGETIASAEVGEPLGPAAWVLGQRLLVGGADGVLHLVNLPRKP